MAIDHVGDWCYLSRFLLLRSPTTDSTYFISPSHLYKPSEVTFSNWNLEIWWLYLYFFKFNILRLKKGQIRPSEFCKDLFECSWGIGDQPHPHKTKQDIHFSSVPAMADQLWSPLIPASTHPGPRRKIYTAASKNCQLVWLNDKRGLRNRPVDLVWKGTIIYHSRAVPRCSPN